MTLRGKLLLAQLPLVGALAVAVIVSVRVTGALGRRSEAVLLSGYRDVLASERVDRALADLDRAAAGVALGRRMGDAQAAAREASARVVSALSALRPAAGRAGAAAAAARREAAFAVYAALVDRLFATADPEAARRLYAERLGPQLFAVEAAGRQVLEIEEDAVVERSEAARRAARRAGVILLFATWLALFAGLAASAVVTARLLRPLGALARASRRAGEGEATARVEVTGDDEVAALARAFNQMADKLREYRESTLGELLLAEGAAQAAIDALPDPVVVFDAARGVLEANEAAARLLRIELRGDLQPLAQAEPAVRDALDRLAAHVLTGKGAWQPERLQDALAVGTPEGTRFFLPRATPVHREGQIRGAAIVLSDVTPLRRFDELTGSLVTTVAREMKTPLTSVRLALHLCLEEAAGPLNARQSDLLYAARGDCEKIQTMVDDLLDLSHLQAGSAPLSLTAMPAADLLARALDAGQAVAGEAGVVLAIDDAAEGASVRVDPERIRLVFDNLVENAVAHSPRGGTVTLRARPAPGAVRFEVADQGPGVPAEYRERVFEKFFRVPGASGQGAGLGLYVAREVVLAHGGAIGVASEEGRGATFWFTLASAGAEKSVGP